MQGLNTTPVHGHSALFGVYGMLGLGLMLFCVRALMPEAEIGELIVELRSATAGAGSFTRQFDHMAEVTGRTADQIITAHRDAA